MGSKRFLVINTGSSTLKYAVFEAEGTRVQECERHNLAITRDSFEDNLKNILDHVGSVDAAGHRVVHGGRHYSESVMIDDGVLANLKELTPLAPLHQPQNLFAIEQLRHQRPDLPQIACFDTAFHRSQNQLSQLYALPKHLTDAGILRYGFHGLSYAYIASILPDYTARAEGKVVCLHLGSGASACAMEDRKSRASSMGFTALDGLMMSTRTGQLDPGVLLYLSQHDNMSDQDIEHLLYKESGLLGVSGQSADMQELLGSPQSDAQQAVDLFCLYAVRAIGALVAELQGLDVLVFTAGVGEHSSVIRDKVCSQLGWLGVDLDSESNENHASAIHRPTSEIDVLVLHTNEEQMIARDLSAILQ